MKKIVLSLLTLTLSLVAVSASAKTDPQVRQSMIVSSAWLAEHLDDKSLVLLHVGDKDEFVSAHIPGAQLIALADISTPRGEGLTLELPSVTQLKTTFEKFGVSNKSRIVIYFGKDWVSPTARVFLTLDYLGLGDNTAILDGGLPAWKAEGRAVTTAITLAKIGSLSVKPNLNIVVNADWVSNNMNKEKVRILDARAPQFYSGAEAGRMPRAGRIPGAKNIPFSSLLEESNNKFKSAAALRALFSTAGVQKDDHLAAYCHIGQQASLLYFVARYLGYDARLYDGSFEDWSKRTDLPVEK